MVNKKPAVFNNSSRIMANTDEQWMAVLVRVGGLRGEACDALARFLLVRRHSSSMLAAAELAVELLDGFTEEGYENLITLLGDGWDQSISQLLDCARHAGLLVVPRLRVRVLQGAGACPALVTSQTHRGGW
jgi:hypothetical protein